MVLIFALPYLVWRLGRTEYFAPLVVVQIVAVYFWGVEPRNRGLEDIAARGNVAATA